MKRAQPTTCSGTAPCPAECCGSTAPSGPPGLDDGRMNLHCPRNEDYALRYASNQASQAHGERNDADLHCSRTRDGRHFAAAGSLAPIAAQEGATAANPYNLPPTHFGSENPQAVHAFDVAPGFADAPVADNPQAPDAKAVGQQVCTACHSKESQVFAHTTHALGMQVEIGRAHV